MTKPIDRAPVPPRPNLPNSQGEDEGNSGVRAHGKEGAPGQLKKRPQVVAVNVIYAPTFQKNEYQPPPPAPAPQPYAAPPTSAPHATAPAPYTTTASAPPPPIQTRTVAPPPAPPSSPLPPVVNAAPPPSAGGPAPAPSKDIPIQHQMLVDAEQRRLELQREADRALELARIGSLA